MRIICPSVILTMGALALVLRLFFPVMHVAPNLMGTTLETCVDHFYPLQKDCLDNLHQRKDLMGDNAFNLAYSSFKPDFRRTSAESVGIVIIFSLLYIIRTKIKTASVQKRAYPRDLVRGVLQSFSEREQKILNMRFGLEDGTIHALEEVSKVFDVTRERIRQIETRAFEKVRERDLEKIK